jgi:ABC-type uncharacterized transport system involved in gliding motility auxiliary subunit
VWYAGGFTDRTAPDLEFTPLLSSSTESAPVPSSAAFGGTEQIRSSFAAAPSGSRFALAARLHGNFRTAFPGGRPAAAAGEEESPAAAAGPALTNGTSTVVLVGDTDMVYDPFCVPSVNALGWNHNLGFFFNAVEILGGSEDLVGLRSRAGFGRPFTRVAKLRQRAEDELRPRLQELQRREQEIVDKIGALEQQRDAGQREVLSQKLQADYASFTQSRLEISREKRDVVRRLRRDIENLGTGLKVLNIAAVPLLVSAAGLAYGWRRRRRG